MRADDSLVRLRALETQPGLLPRGESEAGDLELGPDSVPDTGCKDGSRLVLLHFVAGTPGWNLGPFSQQEIIL